MPREHQRVIGMRLGRRRPSARGRGQVGAPSRLGDPDFCVSDWPSEPVRHPPAWTATRQSRVSDCAASVTVIRSLRQPRRASGRRRQDAGRRSSRRRRGLVRAWPRSSGSGFAAVYCRPRRRAGQRVERSPFGVTTWTDKALAGCQPLDLRRFARWRDRRAWDARSWQWESNARRRGSGGVRYVVGQSEAAIAAAPVIAAAPAWQITRSPRGARARRRAARRRRCRRRRARRRRL